MRVRVVEVECILNRDQIVFIFHFFIASDYIDA